MVEVSQYVEALIAKENIILTPNGKKIIAQFVTDEENINAVLKIKEIQKMMTDRMVLKLRIQDVIDKQLILPNATVNTPYKTIINFEQLGFKDIIMVAFEGLENYGLTFEEANDCITGIPTENGDFKLNMLFKVTGEEEALTFNSKTISIIINADPKSLWKNIDSNTEAPFWKPDNVAEFEKLGIEKHIVVASKRGRSHANVGSFRDDDYAFKHFDESGWSLVCVSDGAGSAPLARQGSKIACDGIVNYFANNFGTDAQQQIDELAKNYFNLQPLNDIKASTNIDIVKEVEEEHLPQAIETNINTLEENTTLVNENLENIKELIEEHPEKTEVKPLTFDQLQKDIKLFLYNNLGKAAFAVHKDLEQFSKSLEKPIKDFHATLIFALYKKYDFGYAILSFGVGDCPIGLVNKDATEIKLMNWLDVGEFGGGTRFITMPEIFSSDKFSSRFGFKLVPDFSYLMLMTDGIYDPKFVVEANLEKIEKWNAFIADLNGVNSNNQKVTLDPNNTNIANELSAWMDFWSPGDHDDRTLAIVF